MPLFTRWLGWSSFIGFLLVLSSPARAQFTTAVQDGRIDAATEYNNNQYVADDQGTPGNSWYVSWNAAMLYLAKTGATNNQPCYVYFDVDPVQPVTDFSGANGGNARGNLAGYRSTAQPNGDLDIIPRLPFRADARLYFQDDYVGVSRRQGDGTWGPTVAVGNVGVANGNREVAVPWDALTGLAGRPASFNFLAYQTNRNAGSGNLRLDLAPANSSAVGAGGGTQPAFERYFTVLSTAPGTYPAAGNPTPWSLVSFTARQGMAYGTFNDAHYWDFTLDYPTSSIERASSAPGTDWLIGGALTVSNGTLTFGSAQASGSTTVGSLLVTGAGVLAMSSTANPLSVTGISSGNVTLSNGGTLALSSTTGGDLRVQGDFTVQGTTTRFQPRGRTVAFVGARQTLTGPATSSLAFNDLTINGSEAASSVVQLRSNITVLGSLTFTQGQLRTVETNSPLAAGYVVALRSTGQLVGEREASALTGYASSRRVVGAGGSGSVDFGLGLVLTPANASAALDSVTVTRSRGLAGLAGTEAASIQRNFRVQPTTTGGSYDVNITFAYFDTELNTSVKSNLALFSSLDATTTGLTPGGLFTKLPLTTLDQLHNLATRNGLSELGQGNALGGVVYTLGDQLNPLPVQLVSFEAARTARTAVRLRWRTGLELQNAGFGIERQVAGGPWQAVTFVPGQGASQGHAYDYSDASAPAGQLYYRLRQLDLDGTAAYSPVVAVQDGGAAPAPSLDLSPVPAPAGQATLTVDLSTLPAAARLLAVYDLQGRLVVQATAPAEATTTDLPVGNIAAGTYLVLVQNGADTYRARFSKL